MSVENGFNFPRPPSPQVVSRYIAGNLFLRKARYANKPDRDLIAAHADTIWPVKPNATRIDYYVATDIRTGRARLLSTESQPGQRPADVSRNEIAECAIATRRAAHTISRRVSAGTVISAAGSPQSAKLKTWRRRGSKFRP